MIGVGAPVIEPAAAGRGTVLELGRTLTEGVRDKLTPVLQDGSIVASLRAPGWRESVSVTVGDRAWVYGSVRGDLVAHRAEDDMVRFRARQAALADGTWTIELDGPTVDMQLTSARTGTHRFLVAGRPIASTEAAGWSARLGLTAEQDVPVEQQVFLLWVALVTRRRHSAAAGI